jgi:colicin import membrane protein
VAAIINKIHPNLILPPGVTGNPEALLEIDQVMVSNGCDVIAVRIKRSSGNPALDEAMRRAVQKSSPLPLPKNPNVFDRRLNITYKPLEK